MLSKFGNLSMALVKGSDGPIRNFKKFLFSKKPNVHLVQLSVMESIQILAANMDILSFCKFIINKNPDVAK